MALAVTSGSELLALFDEIESRREYARVELAQRRLEKLVATSAGFYRGAPALFYALVERHRGARALLARTQRWIVGDVHMENVGVIAVGQDKLHFDFNDLDEALVAGTALDVLRGAASAAVSAQDRGLGPRGAVRAAEAFVMAYLRPLGEELPAPVLAMVARAQKRKPATLLDERCPVQHGARQFMETKRYLPLDKEETGVVEGLFDAYAKDKPLPWVDKRLRLETAAFRVQGTGSLGVRRFTLLARVGKKGEHLLLEAKEMRRSALVRGGLYPQHPTPGGEAARVAKGMAALLSEPLAGVRSLKGKDKRSYLVRLHAPGEDKLLLETLHGEGDILALARMIGCRLAQAHERAVHKAPPAFDAGAMLSAALDLASAMTRAYVALVVRASAAGA